MFILGIVLMVFMSVFVSVEADVVRQDNLSRTLDQARLAIWQLDREIRSGNVVYDPASENNGLASCQGTDPCVAGYTLRIYTQSNADTRASTGVGAPQVCTLWKIDSSQTLWTRQWPPNDPTHATGWRVVATGIVNRSLSLLHAGDPAYTAFTLDTDPNKGYVTTPSASSRTLNIVLYVNNDLTHHSDQTVKLQTSLTGRNTSYGYPANVCLAVPSG